MGKQIGVWLDSRIAQVITLNGEQVATQEILSDREDFHPKGGARSKTPWGPQDSLDEQKYMEREKHQLQSYFQNIIECVKEADNLYIFGPAEAKIGLEKAIESYKHSPFKSLTVETSDQMTLNQKIAKVKAFFSQTEKH